MAAIIQGGIGASIGLDINTSVLGDAAGAVTSAAGDVTSAAGDVTSAAGSAISTLAADATSAVGDVTSVAGSIASGLFPSVLPTATGVCASDSNAVNCYSYCGDAITAAEACLTDVLG
ncbi:unnamed protein product [Ambrosiozyma monospora]|uniref:Unnamed protein product n=1 Tax=Ambrosiozyma monospora TaxID=43982 RepID=A0ACB5UA05_AMBMO|nr:unnamed protein product [Ambrosiozyma monospora]